jgi:hypothetical protein
MKKLTLLFITLCLSASMWALDFKVGLFTYRVTSTSALTVTLIRPDNATDPTINGTYLSLTDVVIPQTVEYANKTYTVTEIGTNAFAMADVTEYERKNLNRNLLTVTIPSTVKVIGRGAFSCCATLHTVTFLGDGLKVIDEYAFYDCVALKNITLPSTLENIMSYAFYYNLNLGDIAIPKSVKTIGDGVFGFNSNLTKFVFHEGVMVTGYNLFEGCTGLTNVTLSNSISSIANGMFKSCKALTSIDIPDHITTIGDSAFYNCHSLSSVEMSENTTTIGICAFYNCKELASIIIPSKVTKIGNSAFYNSPKLKTVYLMPVLPPLFNNYRYIFPLTLPDFYVPCGVADNYIDSHWVNITDDYKELCQTYTIYVNQNCTSSIQ